MRHEIYSVSNERILFPKEYAIYKKIDWFLQSGRRERCKADNELEYPNSEVDF